MLPPEVVAADPNLLRLFRFKPAKLSSRNLRPIQKSEVFIKTNACLFLHKNVRNHLALKDERSSSSFEGKNGQNFLPVNILVKLVEPRNRFSQGLG
jgi:hypothetical protein